MKIMVSVNIGGRDDSYAFEFSAGRFHLTLYRRKHPLLCITMARRGKAECGWTKDWAEWTLMERDGRRFPSFEFWRMA